MENREPEDWKHTTTLDSGRHGEPVGIDLFDDEEPGMVSIYVRHADGTRNPARSVNMTKEEHAANVLGAWSLKGTVHDYRTTFRGVHVQGEIKQEEPSRAAVELEEFYPASDNRVCEETNPAVVRNLLRAKTVTCWGQGPIPQTEWFKLAEVSPSTKGNKRLVIVCRAELAKQLAE